MNESKPWYLSKTICATIISILATVASIAGYPIDQVDRDALTQTMPQLVATLAGLLAIFGRITASSKIE